MSNPDSFIDEVAEAVRRDQMVAHARRYGWIAVLVVVAAVAGAGYWEWHKSHEQAQAEAFGDQLMAASKLQSPAAAATQLQSLDASGTQGVLKDILLAGETAQTDSGAAADQLKKLIADKNTPPIYADLARVKLLLLPKNPLMTDERLQIADKLVVPGGAFRLTGLELRGLIEIDRNENDKAIADFRTLLSDAQSTQGQRQRAQQLIVALGGDPTAK